MSHEGKGEVHLGNHAVVETTAPEATTPAKESPPGSASESAPADSSAPTSPPAIGASGAAVAAAVPPAAVRATENVSQVEKNALSSLGQAQENGPQKGVSSSTGNGTQLASLTRSVHTAGDRADSQGAPAHHSNSPSQGDTASSPSTATIGADNGLAAVSAVAAPHAGAATTSAPVADQLTQAFLAHADAVQQTGRTDFHLRLDPPQLGSVQIHLTATQHSVSARIVVAQEGTRQLLEGQAHHLRQGLAEAGLSLGSFDVTRDGGGSHGGGQQQPPTTPFPSSLPTVASTSPAPPLVFASGSRLTDGINILA